MKFLMLALTKSSRLICLPSPLSFWVGSDFAQAISFFTFIFSSCAFFGREGAVFMHFSYRNWNIVKLELFLVRLPMLVCIHDVELQYFRNSQIKIFFVLFGPSFSFFHPFLYVVMLSKEKFTGFARDYAQDSSY